MRRDGLGLSEDAFRVNILIGGNGLLKSMSPARELRITVFYFYH